MFNYKMAFQLVTLLCASYAAAADDASNAAAAAAAAAVLDLHVVVPNAHADEFVAAAAAAADGSLARPFTSVHAANKALARCGGGQSTENLLEDSDGLQSISAIQQ